jgi:hypothetical protein
MNNKIHYDGAAVDQTQFPEDSPVLVWYPPLDADQKDRSAWAWLPGTILSRCAADEWHVVVDVPALAEPDPDLPYGDAPENLFYLTCFRDASELRPITEEPWHHVRRELPRG